MFAQLIAEALKGARSISLRVSEDAAQEVAVRLLKYSKAKCSTGYAWFCGRYAAIDILESESHYTKMPDAVVRRMAARVPCKPDPRAATIADAMADLRHEECETLRLAVDCNFSRKAMGIALGLTQQRAGQRLKEALNELALAIRRDAREGAPVQD